MTGARATSVVEEVAVARAVQQLSVSSARLAQVVGQRQGMVDQVARLAAAQGDAALAEVLRDQPVDDVSS